MKVVVDSASVAVVLLNTDLYHYFPARLWPLVVKFLISRALLTQSD